MRLLRERARKDALNNIGPAPAGVIINWRTFQRALLWRSLLATLSRCDEAPDLERMPVLVPGCIFARAA